MGKISQSKVKGISIENLNKRADHLQKISAMAIEGIS